MTDIPEPEYVEELSSEQREKLLEFVEQFDQCFSDGSFDKDYAWPDVELIALALRVAEILGFEGETLEQFFCNEFGIAEMGAPGALADMLAIAIRYDVEERIRVAAGGRN
jgi:hypothetical protein